jgi:hypothetical protein
LLRRTGLDLGELLVPVRKALVESAWRKSKRSEEIAGGV